MTKTFSIIGDSISTFQGANPDGYTLFYNEERLERSGMLTPNDTWWAHVVRALGGEVMAVDAWSGSMVEGAGFPAASSMDRARAVLGPAKQALVDAGLSDAALLEADGTEPDVILSFIGINDFGWGGARAQAAGRSHAMPPCTDVSNIPETVPGAAPANAAKLFGQAYEQMLRNLHEVAPRAQIYAISLLPGRTEGLPYPEFAYRLRGIHLDEYNAAIKEAVSACNQAFCQANRIDGKGGSACHGSHESSVLSVSPDKSTSGALQFHYVDVRAFGRDYASLEGTHPTALGMRQFASMVVRGMQIADAAYSKGSTTTEGNCADSAVRYATCSNPALDLDNFCDAPTSEEFCDKPNCIGCPHATDTSSTWMCTCKKKNF